MMPPAATELRRSIAIFWLRNLLALLALSWCLGATAAPTDENQVIVPNSTLAKPAPAGLPPAGTGTLTVLAILLLAGGGAWFLWRGRAGGMAVAFNRTARQLVVEETRSLGSRQYLVVASYQDKKFLLGVCPGRIDLLAPLDGTTAAPDKPRP